MRNKLMLSAAEAHIQSAAFQIGHAKRAKSPAFKAECLLKAAQHRADAAVCYALSNPKNDELTDLGDVYY